MADQPADIERRLDQIVEDEVRASFKDVDLTAELQAILAEERKGDPAIPMITRLRFKKLNPKMKRLVQEATMARYHADLRNDAILSMAQLREINVKRGEWSAEQDKRLEALTDEVNALSRTLYADGLDKDRTLGGRLTEACVEFRDKIEGDLEDGTPRVPEAQRPGLVKVLTRWLEWSPDRQTEFDEQWAHEQGRAEYSPDADLQLLATSVPGVDAYDLLMEIHELRDKLQEFVELLVKRAELRELRTRHAKIFAECVEQRRDTAEEMAKVFYCTSHMDGKGQWVPLGKSPADLEVLPEEVLEWLQVRLFLFHNGMADTTMTYLETMGFTRAPRPSSSPDASAASPAEPTSSADSQPAAATA